MVYKFKCDVKASDLWKLSMYTTYHSFLGVCNIVFAVAMFLLAFRFFGHSTWVVRIILIGLCMIFPVFQPLGTYGYACRQLEELPKNLELLKNIFMYRQIISLRMFHIIRFQE